MQHFCFLKQFSDVLSLHEMQARLFLSSLDAEEVPKFSKILDGETRCETGDAGLNNFSRAPGDEHINNVNQNVGTVRTSSQRK